MEQHLFELALLRAIERLIGVLLGGLAIWLGYRLFMNIPQANEGSAEVDIRGQVKVILTRIAPGVFFALFGATVIGFSFYKSVTIGPVYPGDAVVQELTKPNSMSVASFSPGSYNGASEDIDTDEQAQESQRADVRRAIRTLNQTLTKATAQERARLRPAIETGKFALVCLIWQKDWGKPNEFKAWLNERGTMPASFQEPLTLYQLTGS